MLTLKKIITLSIIISMLGCNEQPKKELSKTAADILGNPEYLAISYGGYRQKTRDIQPTIAELKEDMKILEAIGIKVLRTYNVQLQQAPNLLKAITELKAEDPNFEMYVMLGAWIDCQNAWTDKVPIHDIESEFNAAEIDRAVALAKQYHLITDYTSMLILDRIEDYVRYKIDPPKELRSEFESKVNRTFFYPFMYLFSDKN